MSKLRENSFFDLLGEDVKDIIGENEKTPHVTTFDLTTKDIQNFCDLEFSEDKETNDYLKEKTVEIYSVQSKASVDLGKIFFEANEKLGNQNNGVYLKWVSSVGYAPRTALRHRQRYELYSAIENQQAKNFIAILPVRELEALYSSDEKDEILALLNEGHLVNKDELKELVYKSDKTVEIEVVEKEETLIFKKEYENIYSLEPKVKKLSREEDKMRALQEIEKMEAELVRMKRILKG